MKYRISAAFLMLCITIFTLTGCKTHYTQPILPERSAITQNQSEVNTNFKETEQNHIQKPEESEIPSISEPQKMEVYLPDDAAEYFKADGIPSFSGEAFAVVNNNIPYFDKENLPDKSYESYSALDSLGRCGTAHACIGRELMPDEERGSIGMIKPAGWHTVKYDCVDGRYLYNRCHLIGFQLTGENANEQNLMTGTRFLNVQGMLPFENMTADYIKESENHVAYRVTPIYEGDNLLAAGVLMEGYSVEDQGAGICFCVFAYNAQPKIRIDYSTGGSSLLEAETTSSETDAEPQGKTYILNKNTKRFHDPACPGAKQIREKNKRTFTGSREDIINMGYIPCQQCCP